MGEFKTEDQSRYAVAEHESNGLATAQVSPETSTADSLADQLFQQKTVVVEGSLAQSTSENAIIPAPNQAIETQNALQPQGEVVQGEVIDEEELVVRLHELASQPQAHHISEVDQAIRDALAGRTYQEFLDQEQVRNPQLVEAVNQLKDALEQCMQRNHENVLRTASAIGINAPEEQAEVSSTALAVIDHVPNQQGEDELHVTTEEQPGEEKKYSFNTLSAIAFFVAADLAFFKGSNTEMLVHQMGAEAGKMMLLKMGFDINVDSAISRDAYERMLGIMDTPDLIRYFEESNPDELVKFLENLDQTTRNDMLAGESFGGAFHNKHQFNKEQIAMIFSKLSKEDMERLEISRLNPDKQPVAATNDATVEQSA